MPGSRRPTRERTGDRGGTAIGRNGQDVDLGFAQEPFGDAAEEKLAEPHAPAGGDQNEVGAQLPGRGEKGLGDRAVDPDHEPPDPGEAELDEEAGECGAGLAAPLGHVTVAVGGGHRRAQEEGRGRRVEGVDGDQRHAAVEAEPARGRCGRTRPLREVGREEKASVGCGRDPVGDQNRPPAAADHSLGRRPGEDTREELPAWRADEHDVGVDRFGRLQNTRERIAAPDEPAAADRVAPIDGVGELGEEELGFPSLGGHQPSRPVLVDHVHEDEIGADLAGEQHRPAQRAVGAGREIGCGENGRHRGSEPGDSPRPLSELAWRVDGDDSGVVPRRERLLLRAAPAIARGAQMIPRYSRPEMAALFAPETRLALWLEVELVAAEAMAEQGLVPAADIAALRRQVEQAGPGLIDPVRVEEIERTTRHDVIAFLTHLEERLGPEARWLHRGMTSSDLLDTALAVQLVRACDLLLADLDRVLAALARRAREHRDTPCIGRSHGIHAEPTSFGLKLLGHWAEFRRCRDRLLAARREIGTCAISGPVGTFASVPPAVEAAVAARLGLAIEPVSTQVIPRDRHAALVCALGLLASAVERLATEIRHLQRTEVGEAEEFFHPGQKGSSAMPHKRNPVLSENLCGLARMIRAAVVPALENVVLWHERDISHSSVERVMLPDACILADFALDRLAGLVDRLVVYPERMRANLEATRGLYNSQRVLLALTDTGLPRQEAYGLVQRNAMRAFEQGRPFLDLLLADPEVRDRLGADRLRELFDVGWHLRHVGAIFERVLGAEAGP